MTYDHWKTTNPDDRFLGPEPLPEDEQQMSEEAEAIFERDMALNAIHDAIKTLERTSGLCSEQEAHDLGDYSRTLGLLCMERKWSK